MPKKDSVNKDSSGFIEDFAAALQNNNIIALLGKIFDDKFKSMINIVNAVQAVNTDLKKKLQAANAQIEVLESSAKQVTSSQRLGGLWQT